MRDGYGIRRDDQERNMLVELLRAIRKALYEDAKGSANE